MNVSILSFYAGQRKCLQQIHDNKSIIHYILVKIISCYCTFIKMLYLYSSKNATKQSSAPHIFIQCQAAELESNQIKSNGFVEFLICAAQRRVLHMFYSSTVLLRGEYFVCFIPHMFSGLPRSVLFRLEFLRCSRVFEPHVLIHIIICQYEFPSLGSIKAFWVWGSAVSKALGLHRSSVRHITSKTWNSSEPDIQKVLNSGAKVQPGFTKVQRKPWTVALWCQQPSMFMTLLFKSTGLKWNQWEND